MMTDKIIKAFLIAFLAFLFPLRGSASSIHEEGILETAVLDSVAICDDRLWTVIDCDIIPYWISEGFSPESQAIVLSVSSNENAGDYRAFFTVVSLSRFMGANPKKYFIYDGALFVLSEGTSESVFFSETGGKRLKMEYTNAPALLLDGFYSEWVYDFRPDLINLVLRQFLQRPKCYPIL